MEEDLLKIKKNFESYIRCLGLFWQNFNNLEFFLRLYLNKKSGSDNTKALELLNMSEGDSCHENDITDWRSFAKLCEDFNKYQAANEKIDFSGLIKLRDALAHGRVTGDESCNMVVIKYSQPKNGLVRVEYKKVLEIKDLESIIEEMGRITFEISIRGGAKIS